MKLEFARQCLTLCLDLVRKMSNAGTNLHTSGGKQAGFKIMAGPNFGEDVKGTFNDRGVDLIAAFRAKRRQYEWYFKE